MNTGAVGTQFGVSIGGKILGLLIMIVLVTLLLFTLSTAWEALKLAPRLFGRREGEESVVGAFALLLVAACIGAGLLWLAFDWLASR